MSEYSNIKSPRAGFTIVEALTVFFVISIALIPILSSALSSLDLTNNIRNTFIAANLAQEGVESVRAIRDRNWYTNPGPPYYLLNPSSGTMVGNWRVGWNSDSLFALGSNPPLKIDSNGIYNYTTGMDTAFRREIIIEDGNPGDPDKDMRIISRVTWLAKNGATKTLQTESHLFNWR